MVDVSLLKSRVSGPVLARDDAGFADEVRGWLLNEEHNPEIVVGAASADDVVEAVKFAVANGLVVRAQGTGHGSEVPIQDGILITTKRLDTVTIDKATRIATVGAGLAWSSVVEAAAPLGLLAITGSSSTVGAVGLLLGGGMGPLARSHGFSSDWVRGFELVTGDGELVRADAKTNPDLFWALRGGKGGLGIVTEVDVELVDLPTIYGGSLSFDAPDIEAALRAWVTYLPDLDPDVTTSVALVRVPDLPFIPEPVRGHTLLNVRFAYPGDVATGEQLAAPLRAAAPVYLDALGEMSCGDLDAIHGDPKEPSVGWISARLLSRIDEEFVEMLLRFVGPDKEVPFVAVEVRDMGSATERDVPEGSATSGRCGKGTLTIVGAPNPELFATVVPGAAAAIFDAALPWRSSENLINFAPPSTSEAEYEAIWPRETFDRLQQVRKKYDPKGTFAFFR